MQTLNNALGLFADQKVNKQTFLSVDDSVTLTPRQNIIRVTGFSGAVAVTLPPVGECAGCIFAITVPDDASTNNVTVQDQDDSLEWSDSVINEAGGGKVLVFCDGETFWQLVADGFTAP